MTRPPEDPREQPPGTRQFGPNTDPAAIGEPAPPYPTTGPVDQYGTFGAPRQPPYQPPPPLQSVPSQAYASAGPAGRDEPLDYGTPPPKHTGRTVGLVTAVIAALVVIGIVAFLIQRGGNSETTSAAASSTTQTSVTVVASSTPSSTTTTTTTPSTTTTFSPPGNQVTYQLTGGGSVITVTYRANGRRDFVASTGTPWSESARVSGGTAEITAIVISGAVTCTIMRDGQQLSSATSSASPIPLRCAAPL